MSSITQDKSALDIKQKRSLPLSRERILELSGIAAILLLAAWLRFSNLDSLGYVNHYYTAGVKSMLQSWHNFFFVAAEPGGSVSIDKPPLGLWLQAISAYFLGVNGFSVLLPEIVAGIASVAVFYHLVRRSFGILPGMLAALTLAITPIVVATDRNNTIDSTLILTLLLGAWAFIKATETSKLRYLLLGALLVGIGFNIKMLQAFLPLPAFYALYFFGSKETIWRKIGKLVFASALLLTVSLSWSLAVDLTPVTERPYVGSSSNNSELNLIIGYNGTQRLLGMFRRGGANARGGFQPDNGQMPQGNPPQSRPVGNGFPPNSKNANRNNFPPNGPQFNTTRGNNIRPGGGGMNIGQAGAFRLFTSPLNKEVSWLLPFGLTSVLLLAVGSRWHWPFTIRHQVFVLWGGWLITCVVFFSIAGFFHEYYLSMLAAPLAALVAIGISELWNLTRTKPVLAVSILSIAVIGTIAFQLYTANNFVQNIWWTPAVIALLVVALVALIFSLLSQRHHISLATGFSLMTVAMLLIPGIWSVYTVLSASQNQSLPSSYSGGEIGPVAQRNLQINQSLLDYLQTNTQNIKYLMAVPSSMQGADYVLATERPVLYMGGFSGQDPVVTADDLAKMVSDGELRYVYWNSDGRNAGSNSDISNWVTSACKPIQGFDTATRNAGAPDGTTNQYDRFPQNAGGPGGDMQVSLYDCASVN